MMKRTLRILPLAIGLFVVFSLFADSASAEPRKFRRTRSAFTVGVTSGTFLAGDLGATSGAGLGLAAQEVIQSGYFGGAVRLGASVFSTLGIDIPFDEGVQSYSIALGPRLIIPTFDELELFLFLQPEYAFVGLKSNTLVRQTGGNVQHGAGAFIGAQLFLGSLLVELSIGGDYLWPAQSVQLTGMLAVGFAGLL